MVTEEGASPRVLDVAAQSASGAPVAQFALPMSDGRSEGVRTVSLVVGCSVVAADNAAAGEALMQRHAVRTSYWGGGGPASGAHNSVIAQATHTHRQHARSAMQAEVARAAAAAPVATVGAAVPLGPDAWHSNPVGLRPQLAVGAPPIEAGTLYGRRRRASQEGSCEAAQSVAAAVKAASASPSGVPPAVASFLEREAKPQPLERSASYATLATDSDSDALADELGAALGLRAASPSQRAHSLTLPSSISIEGVATRSPPLAATPPRPSLLGGVPGTPPGPMMKYDSGIALAPRGVHKRTPSGNVAVRVAYDGVGGTTSTHVPSAAAAEAASERHAMHAERGKLAIALVGLPGRGKTFTALKLQRYLDWLGHKTRHFNVGAYRREILGSHHSAEFFSHQNERAMEARKACAVAALSDMLDFLADEDGGDVGILDATNSTIERRQLIVDRCAGHCRVIFLESICSDHEIVLRNVREKVALSPDYAAATGGTAPRVEAAVEDFLERLANYEQVYQTVGARDSDGTPEPQRSYIKMIDVANGKGQIVVNQISGYLPGRIVYFLVNAHMQPRHVFLSRHGQSEFNVSARIGGDSKLSPLGRAYARRLARFFRRRFGGDSGESSCMSGDGGKGAGSASHTAPTPPSASNAPLRRQDSLSDGTPQTTPTGEGPRESFGDSASTPPSASNAPLRRQDSSFSDGTPQTTPTGEGPRESFGDSSVPEQSGEAVDVASLPYEGMSVWTSTLRRTIDTAKHIDRVPQVRWRALDEIDAGVCDGLTYEEIREQMPGEFEARTKDKLRYRYPRGESYLDVVGRLEPVIVELERQRSPILIVAHQAVLRCLYSYFTDTPLKDMVRVEMPLHTLIELRPSQYGLSEVRHELVEAAETAR